MPRILHRVVYWDASIFISWMKGEVAEKGVDAMGGIAEQVALIDRQTLHLATSVIALPEVLESEIPAEKGDAFRDFFKRPNCHMVNVDRRIASLAYQLRDYYKTVGDGFKTLTTPDAIHLATAISFGCEEFYTFDGLSPQKKKDDRKLLTLDGIVAGKYELKILCPTATPPPRILQPSMFDAAEIEDGPRR